MSWKLETQEGIEVGCWHLLSFSGGATGLKAQCQDRPWPWVGFGPFYLANDKGFFKEAGVDVDLVRRQSGREDPWRSMNLQAVMESLREKIFAVLPRSSRQKGCVPKGAAVGASISDISTQLEGLPHVVGGLAYHNGYRFPPEIIQQGIWLYVRFTLSFRDVEDLLAERGALNLIYTHEIEREFGSPDWKRASTLGVLGALTYRIMPKVALGAELEHYRAHEGLGLNTLAGDALYVGPTFHMQVTNKFILSAAFSTQIAGHAAGNANFLDLTNFSRNKALLRAVLEF